MEWRSIPGFEGTYEVSEYGDFRRVLKNGSTRPKSQFKKRGMYAEAVLYKSSVGYHVMAHIAVAQAFIGERPEGTEVSHIDGDSLNNHFSNLKYDTVLNNRREKLAHGTHRNGYTKTHCRNGHEWTEENTRRFGTRGQRVCKCGSL